jgi:hypothetical protein
MNLFVEQRTWRTVEIWKRLHRLDAIVPVNERFRLWFQQDGAPPHFSRTAREELTLQFGENWIGRDGPIP